MSHFSYVDWNDVIDSQPDAVIPPRAVRLFWLTAPLSQRCTSVLRCTAGVPSWS